MQPLKGLTVVTLEHAIAAPFATRQLADLGARVIKIDRTERRIGLSIKAANYTQDQIKEEQKLLDQLKPGEDLVALEHAFAAAEENFSKQ